MVAAYSMFHVGIIGDEANSPRLGELEKTVTQAMESGDTLEGTRRTLMLATDSTHHIAGELQGQTIVVAALDSAGPSIGQMLDAWASLSKKPVLLISSANSEAANAKVAEWMEAHPSLHKAVKGAISVVSSSNPQEMDPAYRLAHAYATQHSDILQAGHADAVGTPNSRFTSLVKQ